MVTEMVMLNILMMAMMKPAMFFSKCAIQNRCSMSVVRIWYRHWLICLLPGKVSNETSLLCLSLLYIVFYLIWSENWKHSKTKDFDVPCHVDWVHKMTTWGRVYHSYKIEMGALRICFSITDVDVNWWRHVACDLCFHVNITYSAHIHKHRLAFTSSIELIDLMDPPDDRETAKT
jgi:hypothetical protein